MEASRSCVRGMARIVLVTLMAVAFCRPASCQGVSGGVGAPAGGGINLPIPIPTSLWFYDGSDLTIDSCDRDETEINGTCYDLLTQGPCQPSDFVLLDPATLEGYCAARLCAPDRIFVFSDQLCHDPFSNTHCPGDLELFQTAFGTPICQCPDGYLELGRGRCVPPLTPSVACPPGQVLWTNTTRLPQVCAPDPCGRLNLERPLPSPPFVPALLDGACYQLGQGLGVCPPGSFYALNLELWRGVCSPLEDAGFVTLDAATIQLYMQLYGHFTPLDHALLMPMPLLPPPQAQGAGHEADAGHGLVGVRHPGGSVVSETSVGGVAISGPRGQEGEMLAGEEIEGGEGVGRLKHPSQHPSQHLSRSRHPFQFTPPQYNDHYIRGNNLGPARHYKFRTLSKHFWPSRLDLTRLHESRGHKHIIRPRPHKPLRPTPTSKTGEIQTRLQAQTFLSKNLKGLQDRLAETRDADDDNESSDVQESGAARTDTRTERRHSGRRGKNEARAVGRQRRAMQSSGGVLETRLVSCRPGARRHVNAKCRHTLLPFFSLPASTFEQAPGVETDVLRRRRRSVFERPPSCPVNTTLDISGRCRTVPSFHDLRSALSSHMAQGRPLPARLSLDR
ncbi:uncharacterized protein LOC126999285 [Eriocheir sinensis]|uniref:uncharacterized protein LOC126999285 n=1 Tax=Eriocheir sinensis TaxID=95602 RepID=UPI0021C7FB1F|nr:uncharacterized protein LOC126999285 [Eriocheir sinensis]